MALRRCVIIMPPSAPMLRRAVPCHAPRRVKLHLIIGLEAQLLCYTTRTTTVVTTSRQAGKVTRRPEHVELAGAAVLPPPALHHDELRQMWWWNINKIMEECGGSAVVYVVLDR